MAPFHRTALEDQELANLRRLAQVALEAAQKEMRKGFQTRRGDFVSRTNLSRCQVLLERALDPVVLSQLFDEQCERDSEAAYSLLMARARGL